MIGKLSAAEKRSLWPPPCPCMEGKTRRQRRESLTKCCATCPGCEQRVMNADMPGHTKVCVAYRQVTGELPYDDSWLRNDPELAKYAVRPHQFLTRQSDNTNEGEDHAS